MARPVIVVTDSIHEDGSAILRDVSQVIEFRESDTAAGRAKALAQADGMIVRIYRMNSETLSHCPKLKVVVLHGSGVDNIDLAEASKRGILVANTPGGALATGMAEGTVTLILAVWKRILELHRAVVESHYAIRDRWRQAEISGRTLGLIGCGHIGKEVARICRTGFGMRVIVYDPFLPSEKAKAAGVEKLNNLRALLSQADIVSIHAPLTETTRGMIGEGELSIMKPSAILVNTSRGGIVDEDALTAALVNGRIRGAGLDVFAKEPPDTSSPLFRQPNVVLAPHVVGLTEDGLRYMAVTSAETVLAILSGRKPETLINPDVWGIRRQ